MLKLKFQYFGHLMQKTDSFKKTDAGRSEEHTSELQSLLGGAGWEMTFLKHLPHAEAEALILWPPDAKGQLIGKDPDAKNY